MNFRNSFHISKKEIRFVYHGYQLVELWKKKKDIYGVMKALAKKTNLKSTDAIWGHWAWVVHTLCKQNISG